MSLTAANQWLAWAHQAVVAGQVLFDKDALRRSEAPIPLDPETLSNADFDAVVEDADSWLPLLAGLEPGQDGLKFRRVDGAVIFQVRRETPFPFAAIRTARSAPAWSRSFRTGDLVNQRIAPRVGHRNCS